MSVSSGSDVTIPIQDSPPPPPSPYGNRTREDSKTPEPSKDIFIGVDNAAFMSDKEEKGGNKETQITINGATVDSKALINEALNPELINLNILNAIPDKPQPEFGPYENFDEYFIPVNHHKKFLGRSEKLYVTKDKRKSSHWKKYVCWITGAFILAAIVTVAVLAGLGLISQKSPNSITESVFGTTTTSAKLDTTTPFVTTTSASTLPPTTTTTTTTTEDQGILSLWTTSSYSRPKPDIYGSNSTEETAVSQSTPDLTALLNTPQTQLPEIHVPSAIDVDITLENLEYKADFSDRTSEKFKELSLELNTEMQNILARELHLDVVYSKIKRMTPVIVGSGVEMRIGWRDEDKNLSDVKEFLRSLENIGNYHVLQGIISTYDVVNLCKFANGECSHFCSFDYELLDIQCDCPESMHLSTTNKKLCEDSTNKSTEAVEWSSTESRRPEGPENEKMPSSTESIPPHSQEPISLVPEDQIVVSSSTLPTEDSAHESSSAPTEHNAQPQNTTETHLDSVNETPSSSPRTDGDSSIEENEGLEGQNNSTEQSSKPEIELETNKTTSEPDESHIGHTSPSPAIAMLHPDTSESIPLQNQNISTSESPSEDVWSSSEGPNRDNSTTNSPSSSWAESSLGISSSTTTPEPIMPTSNEVPTPHGETEEESITEQPFMPVEFNLGSSTRNTESTSPEPSQSLTPLNIDIRNTENSSTTTNMPSSSESGTSTTEVSVPSSSSPSSSSKAPRLENIGEKVIVMSSGVNKQTADSDDVTVIGDDDESLIPSPTLSTQSTSSEPNSEDSSESSGANSSGSNESIDNNESSGESTRRRPFAFSDDPVVVVRTTEREREEMTTVIPVSLVNDTNVNEDEDVTEDTLLAESIHQATREEPIELSKSSSTDMPVVESDKREEESQETTTLRAPYELPTDVHAEIRVTGHPINPPLQDRNSGERLFNSSTSTPSSINPIFSTTFKILNENNSSSEASRSDANGSNESKDPDDENELN